jgi:hypothetical protein
MLGQSLPFPLLAFISFVSGLCVLERRTTIAAHYLPWNAKTFGLCESLHAPKPCIHHSPARLHHAFNL